MVSNVPYEWTVKEKESKARVWFLLGDPKRQGDSEGNKKQRRNLQFYSKPKTKGTEIETLERI